MNELPNWARKGLIAALICTVAACASSGPETAEPSTSQAGQATADARAQAERAEAEARAAARAELQAQRMADEARREAEQAEALAAAEAEAEAEREAQAQAERAAAAAAARNNTESERAEAESQAAARAEAERAAAEATARAEAERAAAEAAARAEAERAAMEAEAAAAEAARLAAEEAERAAEEAERRAAAAAASRAAPATTTGGDSGDLNRNFSQDRPTAQEIATLGRTLTPMGSVRAGNAAGTIPEWTGGIITPPAGYSVGDHHQDPFPNDRPVFAITGQNYDQYLDQLSPGQIGMFERYPDTYRMDVYPTRRSTSFSQRIYDKTAENARTGVLTPNGEGVVGVAEGFPFPIPKNGYHLIWNHKLKYKGVALIRYNNQVAPTGSGAYTLIRLREEILGLYYQEGNTLADINNILAYFYQLVEGPARLAGNVLLVHETLNQTEQLRQAWIYNPGQRRVRRAPNVAYDNPGTASDGLRTNDMTDMFNGAMDRFTWRLVGKREMYVPYNSYKAHAGDINLDDLVNANHLNPDYMRYELHRMWVVEANLKEGVRHINPKRVFYLDEDSYQILLTDHYDSRGDLWRVSEAHSVNYYEVPTFWSTIEVHHDLQSGRYLAVGLDNNEAVNDFSHTVSPSEFTPQSLRTRGRR